MNDVTNRPQGAHALRQQSALVKPEDFDDLGAGIASSFPIIGYRQSKWRLRWQGEEQMIVDERGIPVPEIGVALVKVPDHKSKRYWINGYEQNSRKAPDCWSNDSIRPDPTLIPPVQPDNRPAPKQCSQCFWNEVGSMVSQDGKKRMKACGDYKRVAVKMYYPAIPIEEIANSPMLLTVPAASLKPLRIYGEELKADGLHACAHITYIGFDDDASFQKFNFRYGQNLSDEEYLIVSEMRKSADVKSILSEESARLDPGAPVYAGEGVGEGNGNAAARGEAAPQQQAQAPAQRLRQVVMPAQTQPQSMRQPEPVQQPVRDTRLPSERIASEAEPQVQRYAPPPPPPATPAQQTAQRYAPSARPIQPVQPKGITEAVSRPASPPPTARAVVTEANPTPPSEADQTAEERGTNLPPSIQSKFDQIMGT
jgi:hypothetical protein